MANSKPRSWALSAVAVCALLLGSRVWAGGVPGDDALRYAGTLEGADGPLIGDHFIEVKFWHDAKSETEPADCTTGSKKIAVRNGHFSMPLPAACRDAVTRYPELFVEVSVGGASLGRAKLGAVPYALEAEHAVTADRPEGELKKALADSTERVVALEAATTPGAVVERFNAAVAEGAQVQLGDVAWAATQYDPRWVMQHAAASAGCAASSPDSDSTWNHVVLVKPSGVTCAAACATNAPDYPTCRIAIAVGSILPRQATAYTDLVGLNYKYSCDDGQSAYDEVLGQGLTSSYSSYCCCYRP
jgi:hypothetical protein